MDQPHVAECRGDGHRERAAGVVTDPGGHDALAVGRRGRVAGVSLGSAGGRTGRERRVAVALAFGCSRWCNRCGRSGFAHHPRA